MIVKHIDWGEDGASKFKIFDAYGSAIPVPLPVVITNASTGVEETNATLNGYLSNNGGDATTCYFLLNDTNDFNSPIFNLSKGATANQSEFSNDTAGETTLTKGKLYYFDTRANNLGGWDDSGGVETFLTKPDVPTGVTAQANSTTMIYLNWTTGTGANLTHVERNASGVTSWDLGEGDPVYNGSAVNYEDNNCTIGVTYYYQAWSFTNWTYNPTLHQFSDDNDSASASTATQNNDPTQSNPGPTNGSYENSVTPTLNVTCSDSDSGDKLNATWWSNSSGAWVQFGSNNSSFASGTNIIQTNSNFSDYNKTYYWSVNLTDGEGGWNNETYHFTTENSTTVNLTPATWNLGSVWVDDSNATTGYYFNLTNEGTTDVNVTICATNATNSTTNAAWILNATADHDNYTLEYQKDGEGDWTNVNLTYDDFVLNFAEGEWQTFDLKGTWPTSVSEIDPLTITVTFKSVAA
jgi:hypothetical protein